MDFKRLCLCLIIRKKVTSNGININANEFPFLLSVGLSAVITFLLINNRGFHCFKCNNILFKKTKGDFEIPIQGLRTSIQNILSGTNSHLQTHLRDALTYNSNNQTNIIYGCHLLLLRRMGCATKKSGA